MLKWFVDLYKKAFLPHEPTHLELAVKELEAARRSLLVAQSQKELYENETSYHRQRISRLTSYIATHNQGQVQSE